MELPSAVDVLNVGGKRSTAVEVLDADGVRSAVVEVLDVDGVRLVVVAGIVDGDGHKSNSDDAIDVGEVMPEIAPSSCYVFKSASKSSSVTIRSIISICRAVDLIPTRGLEPNSAWYGIC